MRKQMFLDEADKINAEQVEAAKKAGKEYQGRENIAAPVEPKRTKPSASADAMHAPKTGEEEHSIDAVKAATVEK